MADNSIEVFQSPRVNTGALVQRVTCETRLVGDFRAMYNDLLEQALREFPAIEGYETMHAIVTERMVWMFVQQKMQDNRVAADVQWKQYSLDFRALIKACETLLKEAKNISAEVTFKAKFVSQVMEVIDRVVRDKKLYSQLAQELRKLVFS